MSLRGKLAYKETSHELTIGWFLSFPNLQLHELRLGMSSLETNRNIEAEVRNQTGSSDIMYPIDFTAESENILMLDESKGSTKRR